MKSIQSLFPVLAKFCQSLCLAPWKRRLHIKTEFCNQLGNDTEEAFLAVGRNSLQNMGQCCYEVKVGRDLIKISSAKAATMKALEEYQKRQRQLHELRVTMIHVMAVGNDVILCPIDLFSVATGKS